MYVVYSTNLFIDAHCHDVKPISFKLIVFENIIF